MEYYALKEEIVEVLYFREYCTLEIQNLFRYPYCGTNMRRIAHMVDEVCNEVETRRLPPRAKRGGKREDSSKTSTSSRIVRFLGSLQEEFPIFVT